MTRPANEAAERLLTIANDGHWDGRGAVAFTDLLDDALAAERQAGRQEAVKKIRSLPGPAGEREGQGPRLLGREGCCRARAGADEPRADGPPGGDGMTRDRRDEIAILTIKHSEEPPTDPVIPGQALATPPPAAPPLSVERYEEANGPAYDDGQCAHCGAFPSDHYCVIPPDRTEQIVEWMEDEGIVRWDDEGHRQRFLDAVTPPVARLKEQDA